MGLASVQYDGQTLVFSPKQRLILIFCKGPVENHHSDPMRVEGIDSLCSILGDQHRDVMRSKSVA